MRKNVQRSISRVSPMRRKASRIASSSRSAGRLTKLVKSSATSLSNWGCPSDADGAFRSAQWRLARAPAGIEPETTCASPAAVASSRVTMLSSDLGVLVAMIRRLVTKCRGSHYEAKAIHANNPPSREMGGRNRANLQLGGWQGTRYGMKVSAKQLVHGLPMDLTRMTTPHTSGIVGQSAAVRRVLDEIERVASTNATVLLLGETGTGK